MVQTASVPELSLLAFHQEIAQWARDGILFGIHHVNGGDAVTFVMEARAMHLQSEARRYADKHREEILRYLHLFGSRATGHDLNHMAYGIRNAKRWIDEEWAR